VQVKKEDPGAGGRTAQETDLTHLSVSEVLPNGT